MNNFDELFPEIKRNIENLIEDEEGNIPGKKLLMLGTMVIILGSLFSTEVFAGHRSHRSHSSHRSSRRGHSSHTSHGSHGSTHSNAHSNHGSHNSHASHSNHSNHQSHTSHSNTGSHSNSRYSAEGDVTYSAPKAASVPTIKTAPVAANSRNI